MGGPFLPVRRAQPRLGTRARHQWCCGAPAADLRSARAHDQAADPRSVTASPGWRIPSTRGGSAGYLTPCSVVSVPTGIRGIVIWPLASRMSAMRLCYRHQGESVILQQLSRLARALADPPLIAFTAERRP